MNYKALDEALEYIEEGFFDRFKKKDESANVPDISADVKAKIEKECKQFAKELQSKYASNLKKAINKVKAEWGDEDMDDTFTEVEVDYHSAKSFFDVDFCKISQDVFFELGNKFWQSAAKQLNAKLSKIIKIEDYYAVDDTAIIQFKYKLED